LQPNKTYFKLKLPIYRGQIDETCA